MSNRTLILLFSLFIIGCATTPMYNDYGFMISYASCDEVGDSVYNLTWGIQNKNSFDIELPVQVDASFIFVPGESWQLFSCNLEGESSQCFKENMSFEPSEIKERSYIFRGVRESAKDVILILMSERKIISKFPVNCSTY
ncbi:hypothetical protein KY361_06670 [Candidatus Woesearchaeota archaeon]|nr:hypothetical protein [Candidatus Woesearchaeota archaeon]